MTDVAELAEYDEGVVNSSGTGTLTLSALARTYTGGTLVEVGGKLKLADKTPKCIGTGALTIADGAAVDFNGVLASGSSGFPAVYAAGTGVDGTGAILNTGTQFGNNNVRGQSPSVIHWTCGRF